MYGLLLESIADFAKRLYGTAVWDTVRKKARVDMVSFSSHHQYSETLFQRIMKTLAEVTDQDKNVLMEMLGVDFVDFVSQFGYDRILRVLGRHMRDFLNGLDNLHEYMRFSYQKLKPPSFFVEKESSTGITLHYRSKRKGYTYYVKGQIKQVAKVFYNIDCKIDIVSEVIESDMTHVVFQLHFENEVYTKSNARSNVSMASLRRSSHLDTSLPIKSEIFFELFPFHVVFRENMEITSIGDGLNQALSHAVGESMKDLFNLVRPLMNFNWENIISHTNCVFEVSTIEPVTRDSTDLIHMKKSTKFDDQTTEIEDQCLKLKGQMMLVKEWNAIIFLATPVLENLDIMFNTGFYINDLSMHDSSRDLVLVGTQQSAELKLALDQEKAKSKAVEDSMRKLDVEMKRTDQLLYQMIPKKVADRLRGGEAVMNLCEVISLINSYVITESEGTELTFKVVSSCTILFSDVVGFTKTCSLLAPMEVVSMLNAMYTKFDRALEKHDVYKVETIGDAYMVVSGLPEKTNNHAHSIVDMAFDMLNSIATLPNPATGEPMNIRVGCHSGPVVAGVVGLKMPRYCLFGDTVNTASRMESTSEKMKIHISQSTMALMSHDRYNVVERGKLEVKGKGEMKTYFVQSRNDSQGKPIRCPFQDILEDYARKNPHKVTEEVSSKKEMEQKFTKTEEKSTKLPAIVRISSAANSPRQSLSNQNNSEYDGDGMSESEIGHLDEEEIIDYSGIRSISRGSIESIFTPIPVPKQHLATNLNVDSIISCDDSLCLDPEYIKNAIEPHSIDFRKNSIADIRMLDFNERSQSRISKITQNSHSSYISNLKHRDIYSKMCHIL